MANSLKFLRSMSIEAFKAEFKVTTIEIYRNPKTDKLAFSTDSDAVKGGAVGGDIDAVKQNPQMSQVQGDTGVTFWMLCKKQSDNVIATL